MAETDGAPDLGFYYPTEGANYYVDAMCIPKSSKHPEIAKAYINFMLSEEPAVENAMFLGYASPNMLVYENAEYIEYIGEESMELLYEYKPKDVNADYNAEFGTTCYRNFTPGIQSRVNTLWENLKISGSTEPWIHVLTAVIVISVVSLAVYTTYTKKKRSRAYRLRDKEARRQRKTA